MQRAQTGGEPHGPGAVHPAATSSRTTTRGEAVRWSLVLGAVVLTVVGIVISAAFAVGARRQLVTLGQLSASGASARHRSAPRSCSRARSPVSSARSSGWCWRRPCCWSRPAARRAGPRPATRRLRRCRRSSWCAVVLIGVAAATVRGAHPRPHRGRGSPRWRRWPAAGRSSPVSAPARHRGASSAWSGASSPAVPRGARQPERLVRGPVGVRRHRRRGGRAPRCLCDRAGHRRPARAARQPPARRPSASAPAASLATGPAPARSCRRWRPPAPSRWRPGGCCSAPKPTRAVETSRCPTTWSSSTESRYDDAVGAARLRGLADTRAAITAALPLAHEIPDASGVPRARRSSRTRARASGRSAPPPRPMPSASRCRSTSGAWDAAIVADEASSSAHPSRRRGPRRPSTRRRGRAHSRTDGDQRRDRCRRRSACPTDGTCPGSLSPPPVHARVRQRHPRDRGGRPTTSASRSTPLATLFRPPSR